MKIDKTNSVNNPFKPNGIGSNTQPQKTNEQNANGGNSVSFANSMDEDSEISFEGLDPLKQLPSMNNTDNNDLPKIDISSNVVKGKNTKH